MLWFVVFELRVPAFPRDLHPAHAVRQNAPPPGMPTLRPQNHDVRADDRQMILYRSEGAKSHRSTEVPRGAHGKLLRRQRVSLTEGSCLSRKLRSCSHNSNHVSCPLSLDRLPGTRRLDRGIKRVLCRWDSPGSVIAWVDGVVGGTPLATADAAKILAAICHRRVALCHERRTVGLGLRSVAFREHGVQKKQHDVMRCGANG